MPIAPARRPAALALAALCAALLAPAPGGVAQAGDPAPAVTLAEVASQVDPAATRLANVTELLRRSVQAELGAIDWSKQRLRRRYKVSASLVRLEAAQVEGGLRVSCTVSAAVRDDGGVLLAVVEGRARAEGSSAARTHAEEGALSGAVRGAVAALPEAIRRAQ